MQGTRQFWVSYSSLLFTKVIWDAFLRFYWAAPFGAIACNRTQYIRIFYGDNQSCIILKDVICLIAIHQFITIYYLKVLVKGPYCQYHILDKSFIKGYGWLLCWRSKGNWSFWGSHQRCCCHASCCWSCYLCCWIITLQWGCRSPGVDILRKEVPFEKGIFVVLQGRISSF